MVIMKALCIIKGPLKMCTATKNELDFYIYKVAKQYSIGTSEGPQP